MSKNNNYNDGWQDGYWFGSGSAYDRGYEEGRQAERSRIKCAIDGSSSASESSALGSMIGGSIVLTILGWCFVGLIMFLFWVGDESGSWWFPWIWRIAFWCGIGFIVVMSVAGAIMTIVEHKETKSPEKSTDDPNMPWYKKYPPADVIKKQKE